MPLDIANEDAFQQLDASEKQQWFSENVTEDMDRWVSRHTSSESARPPGGTEKLDPELRQWFETMSKFEEVEFLKFGSLRFAVDPHPDIDWAMAFGRLGSEAQLGIFRGWTRDHPPAAKPADPKFASGREVLITLPDGSQISENWDSDDPDYEPSDYKLPEDRDTKLKPSRNQRILRFGLGGIFSVMLAGGLYLALSGDGDTSSPPTATADTAAPNTTPSNGEVDDNVGAAGPEESIPTGTADWSTEDPFGDFQEWGGFDPIDRTRERGGVNAGEFQDAADLVGISVSASGDGTLVTVSHAGDAQAVQAESEGDFSESVVVVLSDGTRWEVIFRDDGSVKIVSAPPGVSVTKEWITPQQVLFTLSGITVDAGSTIEATLFLEIFGGAMIDVVNLIATG